MKTQEEKSKEVIKGCENVAFLKGYIIGLSILVDGYDKRIDSMMESMRKDNE